MSHIPSASLSLTHRSNILNWLNMQWALTTAFPNRAAEEEKAAYERMVENLVINLVVAELCRDVKEDDGRERVWVTVAERFVGTACQDAGEPLAPGRVNLAESDLCRRSRTSRGSSSDRASSELNSRFRVSNETPPSAC